MPRYLLTESAKADLREILAYVGERSPDGAKRVRTELRSAMDKLASFPHIGHHREDVAPETLRSWSVYSYLIVYRPGRKPLEVIRVLHGARDLPKEFP